MARNVFHDQVLAAHTERRFFAQLQSAARPGLPPDDAVVLCKAVQSGTYRRRTGRLVVGTKQHRVLALERRAFRPALSRASGFKRRIQGAVQRTQPAAFPGFIANRGDHQQIAGTSRRHVGEPHPFGLVAHHLLGFVLVQFVRRPAANLDGAQSGGRIEVPARVVARQLAGEIGENHDRKFESFRLVHRHQAHTVAALFENRRFGALGVRGGPEFVDETAKRDAAGGFVLARQFGDVQHVGQGLFASRPQDEPDVRAGFLEQPRDRVGNRSIVAGTVERLQQS
jgi:hypothetical protein